MTQFQPGRSAVDKYEDFMRAGFRHWTLFFPQDLHATPNPKEVSPEETTSSSTMTKKDCLTSRTVLAGAVVPEESTDEGSITNDEIENRTKIMMHFMDDLTNIYFSTRKFVEIDGGKWFVSGILEVACRWSSSLFQMDHWNGDNGLSTFRDSLAAVTKYSRCKPVATVNFVGENFAQASIVSR